MSDNPTPEEVRASIVPNSSQLNVDDMLTGPITVTVQSVSRGDEQQPIKIEIDGGHRGYRPCKSMRRVLIAAWGDDGVKWVGKTLVLFVDSSVKYGGVAVGGIRISHLSDIDGDRTFMLTTRRGKKGEFHVKKLESEPPSELTATELVCVADAKKEIAAAESLEMLKAIGFSLREKSESLRAVLRPMYEQRKTELNEKETH